MIRRLLVANRGEIALRIIRACRELRIETVAVYSDADAGALHVRAADVAARLGGAPAAESYLSMQAVLAAARETNADALHPGYGFLSENARFAEACEREGLVFVGPSAAVIDLMGSKIEARAAARRAGVPVVPGETPAEQGLGPIEQAAGRVGLPLLLKAAAGGGGKGMRIVRAEAELREAVEAARREAQAAFGDGTLYVERLLDRPRHIEVQVFGDGHGEVVHLFERDCSVQRRHQKVIEESPSPAVTPALRARMTDAALSIARHVGYRNAGTIEFLVEGRGEDARFYFLEMNTRLQVEHPVTELTAGVDLVRAQLLVAGGAPLPWRQDALSQRGHAVECRIYAEDPASDFLPQAGRIQLYRQPVLPGVRIDSGVEEGSEVPVFYDPLLAKLVAYGETRDIALDRAAGALREFPILGVRTNAPFLLRILEDDAFRSGEVHTGFLDANAPRLSAPPRAVPAAAIAAALGHDERADAGRAAPAAEADWDPWTRLTGWHNA